MTPKEFIKELNEYLCTSESNRVTLDTPIDEIEVLFKTISERLPDDELDVTEDPKEEYFKEQNNYPAKIGDHYGC